MICTNCGAKLMDTDQFCPKCGAKAIKDKRCPDCGAVLRDGTRFCHKCGRPVDGEVSADKVSNETLDIPIIDIERNILSETAAEIKADRRKESVTHKTPAHPASTAKSNPSKSTASHDSSTKSTSSKSTASHDSPTKSVSSKSTASHDSAQKNKPVKNTPPKNNTSSKKARAGYREEEDWDDEDDWDEEEEGTDIITIMTAVVGCILLVVVAVLGYHLYRQYAPRNYGDAAQQREDDVQEEQQGQETEGGWEVEISEPEMSSNFTLTVTHNVNVRDNPSTSGSNIIKVAQEGETYSCNGSVEGGEWYEILLEDGTVGYVFHEYVTVE